MDSTTEYRTKQIKIATADISGKISVSYHQIKWDKSANAFDKAKEEELKRAALANPKLIEYTVSSTCEGKKAKG
jgi:hypothetical protein